MTHKPLGRGLGALLSADTSIAPNESIELDETLIEPCPVQPRTRFDDASLSELAQSIKANGVVQPLLVRRSGGRFELIAGERRLRAARLAGLRTVPAVIKDVPDEKLLEIALVENIQREDLNPIEEAHAYRSLLESVGLTQEALASRIGRDRSYVTNYLRLLRLPPDVQNLLANGEISMGHARSLLGLTEPRMQRETALRIVKDGLSVRDVEKLIRESERPKSAARKGTPVQMDPNVRALEAKLRRELGTKVSISQQQPTGEGVIQIKYFSVQDLNRIADQILSGRVHSKSHGV